jgi:hypothetical protein
MGIIASSVMVILPVHQYLYTSQINKQATLQLSSERFLTRITAALSPREADCFTLFHDISQADVVI